ncbi:ROK family glucokinase [Propionicicella superfundia]|uniref:ROK family glucokinase n=1 Tax=Propionicicella superfundia TaxID=348582 RepID=UPI00041348BE|nr:ROK family glucokinase [Propionicicella superfundia]
MHAIGVDVGGTKIAAGVVDEEGTIVRAVRRPTPAGNPTRTAEVIVEAIQTLRDESDAEVGAVGIGAAGFVDAARTTVVFAPNLAWRDEPLRERVEGVVGIPVRIENDANAAAWAEARFGAGHGARSVVVVTVGTGIGGGIIFDGRLLRGGTGMAGEIGHLRLVPGGHLCGCGQRGCWEQYASGSALVRDAREFVQTSPDRARRLLHLAGGDPAALTGQHVTVAAQEGDAAALGCFADLGEHLGAGMASLAAVLDPEVFVLAGGVSEAGKLLLKPAKDSFLRHLSPRALRPRPPKVRLSVLGNPAGIIGAADLAREG